MIETSVFDTLLESCANCEKGEGVMTGWCPDWRGPKIIREKKMGEKQDV